MSKIFIGLFLSIFLLSPVAKISAGSEKVGLESESLEGSSSLDPVNPVLGCLLLHSGKMQRMVQNISIPSIDGSRQNVLRDGA